MVSAQQPTMITQGEHHALHDDYVSERLHKRKGWMGARLQRDGGDGQVQRGTREGWGAGCAGRADSAGDYERARYLQGWKVESDRRSVYRSEGGGGRLLDYSG